MPPSIRHFFTDPPLRGGRFRVDGIGIHEELYPQMINRPQGNGYYLIIYFHTQGRAGFSVEDAFDVGADTLIFWPPGVHQYYGGGHAPMLHSWTNCEGSVLARLLESNSIPVQTPIKLPSPHAFLRFLEDLYHELSLQSVPDEAIAENLLENWLRDLGRTIQHDQHAVPEKLREIREYIDIHCAEQLSIARLAGMANWSPTHFTNSFRKHFGTSPIDYVVRQRMHRAAYLLRDVNLSITEIARRIGYDDIYYFSKFFKKRWGMSPLKMRQSLIPKTVGK